MPVFVVGEVIGAVAIADNEELEKAEERTGVTITRVVLIINNLFHSPARIDAQGLQLYLHDWYTVDRSEG